jgi:hypothetical protein
MLLRHLMIFHLLLVTYAAAIGQKNQSKLSLILYNHSFSSRVFSTPANLGIVLQYDRRINDKIKNQWYLPVATQWISHRSVYNAIGISTGISYRYQTSWGAHAGWGLMLGYLRHYDKYQRYAQNSDGRYEKKTDRGRGSFFPSLQAQLGFEFLKNTKRSVEVFTRYQLGAQTPFTGSAPLILHPSLQVGVAIQPLKK